MGEPDVLDLNDNITRKGFPCQEEASVEVLRLVARGLTNADIAECLHLSEGTVRNYVSAVLAELDVSDRTRAAVIALRYGLVDLSEI